MKRSAKAITALLIATLATSALPATANVHLEWRVTSADMIRVGDTVDVGLYAVSDDTNVQAFAGMDVVFSWDPAVLEFQSIINNGDYAWLSSFIPAGDSSGINEQSIPSDGDGLYLAMCNFTGLPYATPSGLHVTTFRFVAVSPACDSYVDILASAGQPETKTIVWSAMYPNTSATGELRNLEIAGIGRIDSADCDADNCPDECQPDRDRDTVIDACDNCPKVPNRRQLDSDHDGIGDACRRQLPPITPQTPSTGSVNSFTRSPTSAFNRTITGESCGAGTAAAAMTMALTLTCLPLMRGRRRK